MATYSLLQLARHDTMVDIRDGVVSSINEVLHRHGPDPENTTMVCAALAMVIEDIGVTVDRHFVTAMIEALQRGRTQQAGKK